MRVPDEIRDLARDRVLAKAERVGDCILPRVTSIEFQGNLFTPAALWAVYVTGRVAGHVNTGICAHLGCIAHVERVGEGSWELDSHGRLKVHSHHRCDDVLSQSVDLAARHPVPTVKTSYRAWWIRWHGTPPRGRVDGGQCGVKGCVRHLRDRGV